MVELGQDMVAVSSLLVCGQVCVDLLNTIHTDGFV